MQNWKLLLKRATVWQLEVNFSFRLEGRLKVNKVAAK